MRYLRVLWTLAFLPVLLFAQSAEAARISFATENCGTPPLLGLEFQTVLDPTTSTVIVQANEEALCPDGTLIGSLVGDGTTTPYGTDISTLELTVTGTPEFSIDSFASDYFGEGSLDAALRFIAFDGGGGGILTVSFEEAIGVSCGLTDSTFDGRACFPADLAIHIEDFPAGLSFVVSSVNGVSVPEPGTLSLLALSFGVGALRRRTAIVRRFLKRASSAPDTARRI